MKLKIWVLSLTLLLSITVLSGCKEEPQTNGTEEFNQTETNTNQIEDAEQEENTEDVDTEVDSEENDEMETVSQDAYDAGETTELVENVDISHVETDAEIAEEVLSEIALLTNYAYYNFLWHATTDEGVLTKENMQRFAISYIYQYEYNELFFDTNEFVLYIPEQMVTDIIKLFFDERFTTHGIESDKVVYEEGYYLMPATDNGIVYEPTIVSVVKETDFSYKVIYESSDPTIGVDAPKVQYEIGVEERDGRYIYTSYKMIVTDNQ